MSKLPMLAVIVTVTVLIAKTALHVQARPGPLAFHSAETLAMSSRQLLSAETVESDLENVNLSSRDAEELDSEEELDAVCIENGSCDERRLLTASIDYRNFGPNDPITDPPH